MGNVNITLEEIKRVLIQHKAILENRYRVREIGVFGSFVRAEAGEASDVDILVSFRNVIDYFDFLELEEYLTELIGIPVDLVEKDSLKPHIGERIMNEVVML